MYACLTSLFYARNSEVSSKLPFDIRILGRHCYVFPSRTKVCEVSCCDFFRAHELLLPSFKYLSVAMRFWIQRPTTFQPALLRRRSRRRSNHSQKFLAKMRDFERVVSQCFAVLGIIFIKKCLFTISRTQHVMPACGSLQTKLS